MHDGEIGYFQKNVLHEINIQRLGHVKCDRTRRWDTKNSNRLEKLCLQLITEIQSARLTLCISLCKTERQNKELARDGTTKHSLVV